MSAQGLIPPYPVLTAILAGVSLVLFLAIIGRLGPRIPLGLRFRLSLGLAAFLWLASLLHRYPPESAWVAMPDVLAGLLVLATACLGIFSAWSLLAYGYTVSMLDAAAQIGSEFDQEAWMRRYGAGRGLEGFYLDRLEVLRKFRLARIQETTIALNGHNAVRFGRLACLMMRIFAVPGARR